MIESIQTVLFLIGALIFSTLSGFMVVALSMDAIKYSNPAAASTLWAISIFLMLQYIV